MRPPQYFPALPYAALVQRADCFVLADTFEHSRRSRQNRARLRTPQGAQWITVPIKRGQTHRPVAEVEIDNRSRDESTDGAHWRSRHRRAMQCDYRSTPYFAHFEPALEAFFGRAWRRLGPCACASTRLLAEWAGLEHDLRRASALPGSPDTLPSILEAVGAKQATVLVPSSSAAHDAALLEDTGHAVRAFAFDAPRYRQAFAGFEPGMSFADLLFGYGPEARALLAEGARVETPSPEAPS